MRMLLYSKIPRKNIPVKIRIIVMLITVLECRLNLNNLTFSGFLNNDFNLYLKNFLISKFTKNPNPPIITKSEIVKIVTGSLAYLIKLLENRENPALQKADIEWKIEKYNLKRGELMVCHLKNKIPAPNISIEKVKIIMYFIRLVKLNKSDLFKLSFKVILSCSDIFLPIIRKSTVEKTIRPSPPNCINVRRTNCPVSDNFE